MGLDLQIDCSEAVLEKLRTKHNVTLTEVKQCFMNIDGGFLEDPREEHKTTPATEWFIAETHKERKLKVCFVQTGKVIDIKTAYPPDAEEIRIYNAKAY